jgi:3-oxoacyl-[acyl-carrier protein] reductase
VTQGGPETRHVLVTGASRGIGRAIALTLSRAGFDLALHYHTNQAAVEETLRLCAADGGRARVVSFDLGDRPGCQKALELDMEAHGTYYGVVCNAGVHADAPFPALSGEAWDRVLRTNLDGFYNVLRPVVARMVRTRGGGRIVTISSAAGIAGNRGQVNYSASKAGLIGATRALAQELAKRGITVNSVAPGLIDTEMIADAPVDQIVRMIPMRRLGRVEDVAAVVGFLFSEGAGYITGQVISVNGGLL